MSDISTENGSYRCQRWQYSVKVENVSVLAPALERDGEVWVSVVDQGFVQGTQPLSHIRQLKRKTYFKVCIKANLTLFLKGFTYAK